MRGRVSGVVMALLLLSVLVFPLNVRPVKAPETIYITIMLDGSISSPVPANITTSDNITYTFTGNNYLPIYVGRSNIIINGMGYTLQALGENGFSLYNMNNVTISNTTVENSANGVYIQDSSGIVVSGNNVTANSLNGIFLYFSNGNTLSGNNIIANDNSGILLFSSSSNTVNGNSVTANGYDGIWLYDYSDGNTVSGNNFVGNGVGTLENQTANILLMSSSSNRIIGNNATQGGHKGIELVSSPGNMITGNNVTASEDDGIEVLSSSGSTVSGNNAVGNGYNGILVNDSSNTRIIGNNVSNTIGRVWFGFSIDGYGIHLLDSSNCTVSENNEATSTKDGIYLFNCSNSTVSGNSATANNQTGIYLVISSNNTISGNNAEGNSYEGIWLWTSSNNKLNGNNATSNGKNGIYLYSYSDGNTLSGNNITANSESGISLDNSSSNVIYHNNFINNNVQASIDFESNENAWNDAYPSGGNYWSDYLTRYPDATQIDSSGIWNTPYIIDANNRDNYPLMSTFPPSAPSVTISPSSITLDVGQSQTFTTTVTDGTSPYSYQWYLDGVAVSGATGSSWTFVPGSAGSYSVYANVTDEVGLEAKSNVAAVTVNLASYLLTVNVSGHGITNATGTFPHDAFSNVTVLATPDPGYFLDHWLRNGSSVGSNNPYTLNMTADYKLTAVFSAVQRALTVTVVGNGVTNATGTHSYAEFTNVTVLAVPDSGWVLESWTLNGTIYGPTSSFTINMTANYSLIVTFTPIQYNLTVTVVGNGVTNVTGTHSYNAFTNVTVLATPASGYFFDHWLLNSTDAGSLNPYTINMMADYNLTALFAPTQHSFEVSTTGSGSVVLNNTGPYYYGDDILLTAIPSSGWSFDHWEGDLSGSLNPAVLTITSNTSVTAVFTRIQYNLTVSVSGHGSTNTTGTFPYDALTNVTVLATPDSGYFLDHWTLNGTAYDPTNPFTVNMTANFELTAIFMPMQYSLTVNVSGQGSTNATGTNAYAKFTNVTVLATPASGYFLDHWTLNGTVFGPTNPFIINMTADYELTAVFAPIEYNLFVGVSGHGVTNITGTFTYTAFANVSVLASPDSGYYLSEWLLNGTSVGSVNPYTVSMIHNYNLTAVFRAGVLIPLSGWTVDPAYTNATNVLGSSTSSLYLELDAENTNSKVVIYSLDVPKLSLSSYTYVDAAVTGTDNARILLRFFMDDGTCFDVVYWGAPATLNITKFDLSPYAVRTLSGVVYIALMSADGKQANMTVTQIAFSTQALPTTIPLSGWNEDPLYTNAPYVLDSKASSLYLELDATGTNSKVTISNFNIPKLSLSDYTYVSAMVTGTDNARVLLRFFMDDGSCFDVVYWQNPNTLNATKFDLSPYAGRTLGGVVYFALMSADEIKANITITQIDFSTQALAPTIPLSGWVEDPVYTNAPYVLNSNPSSLYLQLDAENTTSKVTIFDSNIPKLGLSDYTYVNVTVAGSDNARVLLRFFLDDGTCFDVVYWGSPATLNAIKFDLTPYAGRMLSGEVYVSLMSSDGKQANVTMTQIAFSTQALPSTIPLVGWQEDPQYTNATYVLSSSPSSLYLQLDTENMTSKVVAFNPSIPKLSLSDYTYINVTVSGTDNAKILLRFFMDDGTCFDVVYWGSPATLNATEFDLTPYAGRTLSEVYVALMSSDGNPANVTITQIAFINA